jgi:hypothetical protein
MLSLLHNSVVSKPNYRLFVIHKFPNLKILDFKKVKDKVEISIFFEGWLGSSKNLLILS